MRTPRSPLRSLGVTFGSVVAAWFFLGGRRRYVPHIAGNASDRFSVLLNATLPLLVPVIGMRAAALLTALAAAPAASRAARLPVAAPLIDLDRYAGTWYEIGHMPTPRERQCADDVTATYVVDGGGMRVLNRCRHAGGHVVTARGRARVVDPASCAKLKITFLPALLHWLPMAWADYWILDVAPDYRRAIVGTPDRRSLWILAREESIPASEYQTLLQRAAAQGYDTQRMRVTTHASLH